MKQTVRLRILFLLLFVPVVPVFIALLFRVAVYMLTLVLCSMCPLQIQYTFQQQGKWGCWKRPNIHRLRNDESVRSCFALLVNSISIKTLLIRHSYPINAKFANCENIHAIGTVNMCSGLIFSSMGFLFCVCPSLCSASSSSSRSVRCTYSYLTLTCSRLLAYMAMVCAFLKTQYSTNETYFVLFSYFSVWLQFFFRVLLHVSIRGCEYTVCELGQLAAIRYEVCNLCVHVMDVFSVHQL